MDMLFTHFGISGPAVLRCSQFAVKALMKEEFVMIEIDALPKENHQQLMDRLMNLIKDNPKKSIKNILKGLIPERYLDYHLTTLEIHEDTRGSNISKENIRILVQQMKSFQVKING